MRVRGRSEFFPPSYTRCACSISMPRSLREGIHLERLTLRKPAAVGALRLLWQPHQPHVIPSAPILHIRHLLGESLQLILKSVTVLLSSRAAAWMESTRSRVCFAALASASSSALSSLTELWSLVCPHAVHAMLGSAQSPPHLLLSMPTPNPKCFAAL